MLSTAAIPTPQAHSNHSLKGVPWWNQERFMGMLINDDNAAATPDRERPSRGGESRLLSSPGPRKAVLREQGVVVLPTN